MSRARCSLCRHVGPDGTATVYARTYYPSGLYLGHRLSLCPEDSEESLLPLLKETPLDRAEQDNYACVLCGEATAEDPYYYYFYVYPPGGERSDHEALLCFKCHALTVEWISAKGRRLPERNAPAREEKPLSPTWALLAG